MILTDVHDCRSSVKCIRVFCDCCVQAYEIPNFGQLRDGCTVRPCLDLPARDCTFLFISSSDFTDWFSSTEIYLAYQYLPVEHLYHQFTELLYLWIRRKKFPNKDRVIRRRCHGNPSYRRGYGSSEVAVDTTDFCSAFRHYTQHFLKPDAQYEIKQCCLFQFHFRGPINKTYWTKLT